MSGLEDQNQFDRSPLAREKMHARAMIFVRTTSFPPSIAFGPKVLEGCTIGNSTGVLQVREEFAKDYTRLCDELRHLPTE